MHRMDDFYNNENAAEPEIIQAEVVDMAPVGDGLWVRSRPARPRSRLRLHILLFVATCLSTLLIGTGGMIAAKGFWVGIAYGLRYAVPLMTILFCHEMGHYLQAKRYGVRASLPYFLPMPLPPIGTFGAVIAMEQRVPGRRALFDIGITGPLAGLVPTMIFLVIGLLNSKHAAVTGNGWVFGEPLLFSFLAEHLAGPIPPGHEVITDPMAFAGWVGLLVTSLNLMPIGQLDGGHILYAILGRKARKISLLLLFSALAIVVWNFSRLGHWSLILFLLFLFGPIHPPTANDSEPLDTWRIVLGWLALAFILIGFTPIPIVQVPY